MSEEEKKVIKESREKAPDAREESTAEAAAAREQSAAYAVRELGRASELVPDIETTLERTTASFRETMASFRKKIQEMKAGGEAHVEGIFLDSVNELDSDMEAIESLMRKSVETVKDAPPDTDEDVAVIMRQYMQDFGPALKQISDGLESIQRVIVERADNPDKFVAWMNSPLDKMKDLLRRIKRAYPRDPVEMSKRMREFSSETPLERSKRLSGDR